MFQKKKKRQTHFTQHKKSSLFSTISLKDKPKRKKKAILKSFFIHFSFSSVFFVISLGILFIFFQKHPKILSPLPAAVSRVLGVYVQNTQNGVETQVKEVLLRKNVDFSSIIVRGNDVDVLLS